MKLYRGNVLHTPAYGSLETVERGVIAVDQGLVEGVYGDVPERLRGLPLEECGDRLLIPAFVDVHLHSSQGPIRALGHDDGEDWFADYCGPVERRYADLAHADALNRDLIHELWQEGTMHANIMGTVHPHSALNLFEHFLESGMAAFIGKMNSDHGAFAPPLEETEHSIRETRELVSRMKGRGPLVRPALCPEFAPACTEEMMGFLGALAKEEGLIIHSHMCEGGFDNDKVAERFPQDVLYGKVYQRFGLFGDSPTVMAHCTAATDEEIGMMAERGVMMAHCPNAVLNDAQGGLVAAAKFIAAGVPVGLGSDIGGGYTLSIPRTMVAAMQMSKRMKGYPSLTVAQAFYLATKGGGALFGKVGSFEKGAQFSALVVDDSRWNRHASYTLAQRLERYIYCGDSRDIVRRFCAGAEVPEPRPA